MEPTSVIALAALGLSALTFIVTQFTGHRSASKDYVEQLEERIEKLEKELGIVTQQRDQYRDENITLMRKLISLGETRP